MKKRIFCLAVFFYLVLACYSNAFGAVIGDVNNSGNVDVKDAVITLQICAGLNQSADKEADVNGDGKIGLQDAIYGLQYAAGFINKVVLPAKSFEESSLSISYQEETGNVRFLKAEPGYALEQPIPVDSSASSEEAARSFLSVYSPVFGIENQEKELDVIKTRTASADREFVRFQQKSNGIPVLGGELIVQMDSAKNVISVNGEILPDSSINTVPVITAEKAVETALAKIAEIYPDNTGKLTASEPELLIYNPLLLGFSEDKDMLVWHIEVKPDKKIADFREFILVDANSGLIVLNFNQVDTVINRETYDYTIHTDEVTLCRSENGEPSDDNSDCNAAHDYAGDAYNFYYNEHGRDSIDDKGMKIVSYVYYGDNYCNAFWDGQRMIYGGGCGVITDDIVAHEYTHGVIQNESGLLYLNQSGAITESLADIWGEFVDQTNGNDTDGVKWKIGEAITGSDYHKAGALRDMKDPATFFKHPDKISSEYYYCDKDYSSEYDRGGVHVNCGVGNKAAYLMTDGGTFNGKTVKGLGYAKVADLFYEVQTNRLTSAASYADLYDALIDACGDLGYSLDDCQQVKNALDAVEMSVPPCFSISPASAIIDGNGGTGSIKVKAQSNNKWSAISNNDWIKTSGAGTGDGTVTYSVDSFTGQGVRTGTIKVGPKTFTVNQVEHKVISFPDKNLESVIRAAVGKDSGDILWSDVWGLKILSGFGKEIENLEGLQYCSNLAWLYLGNNKISNITAIGKLANLSILTIGANQISDISPLADLSNLRLLNLSDNQIGDITAITNNKSIAYIDLYGNQLNKASCSNYIPQLIKNGVLVNHNCLNCIYDLSEYSKTVTSSGGTLKVNVITKSICTWTATNNVSWITVSPKSGTGNGTVNYTVDPNSAGTERTGTLVIAGNTFTVKQSGVICTYTISPENVSFEDSESHTGLFVEVTAPKGCNWSVTNNTDWINTKETGGNGSASVNYSVSSNPDSTERTGTITIAGKIFTVKQSGAACTYKILPENEQVVESVGGTYKVTVSALTGCIWSAASNKTWITLTGGNTGNGSGTVTYSVASNPYTTDRTGTLTIKDKTLTVIQKGVPCIYKISPAEKSFESNSGTGSVTVTATDGCTWTASKDDASATWIDIDPGTSSGTGNGTVKYSVDANPNITIRSTTLTIAGKTFTVTQTGVGCTYSLSSYSNTFNYEKGEGSVTVTTPNGCVWSVSGNSSWIKITSENSGTGNGTVVYSVDPNPDAIERTGTLTIADKTFTITQTGLICTYSISSADSQPLSDKAGTYNVSVTAQNGCDWTAKSNNPDWITIKSGASGNGNGTVEYSVSANPDATTRTGTLTIAEKTFTVTQSGVGCGSYSISPSSQSFTDKGGTGSVSVTAPKGCEWTVSGVPSWITITAGAGGNGNGVVAYSVSAKTDFGGRDATLTIAGNQFKVTQTGVICTYKISPIDKPFDSAGGTGIVDVIAPNGCGWSVTSNVTWLTSGSTGTGSGTVNYSVAANSDSATRTGTMTIAGNIFTVTQTGCSVVYFPDKNLEAAIRNAISKPTGDISSCDLKKLTSLYVYSMGKPDEQKIKSIEGIQYCTNLTSLWLTSNQISDISAVAGLTNLTSLNLWGNQISDISAVKGLTNLTSLDLSYNQISDISAVAGLTHLTSLGLTDNQISDISAVAGLTHLTSLGLNDNQINNISVFYSVNLKSLTSLSLSGNQIEDISAVENLQSLTSLSLNGNQIEDISALAYLTMLTDINLCCNKISDSQMINLKKLDKLRSLELSSNQISSINALNNGLFNPENLTSLGFSYNPINGNISDIAAFKNLTRLSLNSNQISDIIAVANLQYLTLLYLSGNQISDKDMVNLIKLTSLTSLSLDGNQISDISAVAGLTNLTSLNLWGNQISDIKPLVDNSGINSGDIVYLFNGGVGNPLSPTSCNTYIPQLQSRGVTVEHDCTVDVP